MMETPLVKIQVENDDIVIRVNKNDLKWIAENDPTYKYLVHDVDKFAKEVAFEIENSTPFSNAEGINRAEELFQWAYEQVAMQGDDDIMTGEELNF